MASKGYVKIENDLFTFLYSCPLNATELKVLLFLVRFTKGFNRPIARASYGYIAKGINKSESSVKNAIKSLVKKEYIKIEYPALGSKAQLVKISYENLTTLGGRKLPHYMAENDHKKVVENYHKKVVENYHQDITEDITEDITDKYITNIYSAPREFLECETSLMREMSVEERQKYLDLLPKYLWTKPQDDYTDEEWDVYDEWRMSNGLI